jgi:phage pi2 protein 07
MLDLKKILQRPIIWKAPLKDNGYPSWDELDMFDKKVVKELLRVHKGNDLQDDLTCIIEDLKILIEKIDFTDKQRKILDMWSCGMTAEDISKYTKTTGDAVLKALDTIVNKIIKQYEEEYTDWYYLNICKGEYKKCSKCGEIKLVSNFCKNGNRLRGNCKNCR